MIDGQGVTKFLTKFCRSVLKTPAVMLQSNVFKKFKKILTLLQSRKSTRCETLQPFQITARKSNYALKN